MQAVCNRSDDKPPKEVAERLEQDQLAAIRWPADGKLSATGRRASGSPRTAAA